MAEYVALSPDVEVLGQSALAVIHAINTIGAKGIDILKKYNMYPIEPDRWYNQQDYLNVYEEINDLNLMNMVAIGMRVPDEAEFPPDIQTVEDALKLLDVAYKMNHRGGDIGEYAYERTGERSAKLVCRNPYPSDFDYGLIYRLVQKYRPDDSEVILVELDFNAPSRKDGADSCTYRVQW
jgi:hypothetical protein